MRHTASIHFRDGYIILQWNLHIRIIVLGVLVAHCHASLLVYNKILLPSLKFFLSANAVPPMIIVGSINDNLLFFRFTIMNGQRSHVSDVLVDSYGERGPLLGIGEQETARAVLIAKVAASRCHIFEGSIPATKRNAPLGSTLRWIVHQRQITSRCGQELLFHGIV